MKKRGYTVSFEQGDPMRPGAHILSGGISFCASFADPSRATLVLFSPEFKKIAEIPMGEGARFGAFAAVFVRFPRKPDLADPRGIACYYYYLEDGMPQADPYAVYYDGKYCGVCPERVTDHVFIDTADAVSYELHVKGFTMEDPSVSEEARGTFRGVIEKIPYLKSLGINVVELMPSYSFSRHLENGRKNYWGYAGKNIYSAPCAAYAAEGQSRTEALDLADALHAEHMMYIQQVHVPDNADMTALFYALRVWYRNVGADGFRFSGNPQLIRDIVSDPYLSDTVLITESVSVLQGSDPIYQKREKRYAMYWEFRNAARHFLKGDKYYAASFTEHFRSKPHDYGYVNAICDHNGFTLADLVSYNYKHNEVNGEENRDGAPNGDSMNCGTEGRTDDAEVKKLRVRQKKNALVMLYLSSGVPLLRAGDEAGNSQEGNNNAYASDDPTGYINWLSAEEGDDLVPFIRALTDLRREHGILHMEKGLRGADFEGTGLPDISFHSDVPYSLTEKAACAILFNEAYDGTKKKGLLLAAFNMTEAEYTFSLPDKAGTCKWKCVLTSAEEKTGLPAKAAGKKVLVMLPPRACAVYLGK